MKIRTEFNNQKMLYPLAMPWTRFFASLLDGITTVIIGVIIYFLSDLSKDFTTTIILTIVLGYIVFIVYFLAIPYFTRGYTLFRYLFKIKLIELIDLRKYFYHLFLHDLFVWIHFSTLTLIYMFITISLPAAQQEKFFTDLYNQSPDNTNIVSIVFRVLYSVAAIISVILLIYTFLRKGNRNLQDLLSWTAMISLNKPTPENKNNNFNPKGWRPVKPRYHLPGEIDPDALNDLDDHE
ncbi:RDD family protein [[Mycoplasma] testudinis]|uniref:RDD family protein n=1 Tax=[Mycoplasma] testudinis TaxID=33924 RepID=UPI000487881B|nr:RDD family protein [[Mycoplasma] testudinis]